MSINTFANIFPFVIAPGAELSLPVNCEFVYISALSGGSIELETGQGRVPLIVGRRVAFSRQEIGAVRLKNKGTTTATGELLVGSGDVRDSNVVGTVNVINSDKIRTEEYRCFSVVGTMGSVLSEYSSIYLVNQAGSGVKFVLSMILAGQEAGGSGSFSLFSTNDYVAMEAALAFTRFAGDSLGINKYVGQDDAQGMVSRGSSTEIATETTRLFTTWSISTPGTLEYRVSEPIIVSEGMAVGVGSRVVSEDLWASFQWYEE